MNELVVLVVFPIRVATLSCGWGTGPYYDLAQNLRLIAFFGGLTAIPLAAAFVLRRFSVSHRARRVMGRILLAVAGLYAVYAFVGGAIQTEATFRLVHVLERHSMPFREWADTEVCVAPWSIADVAVPYAVIGVIWIFVLVMTERVNGSGIALD